MSSVVKWFRAIFQVSFFVLLCHFTDAKKGVEQQLLGDIFLGYQRLVLPVPHVNDSVIVYFGLQFVLLINIDERNQVMQSNVWLTLYWNDYRLSWKSANYDNLKEIRIPPDRVWQPDIVLYNNADGQYEASFLSNILMYHNGNMLWVPPALYKSTCIMDVEFFPFDEQSCHMEFASWTYSIDELRLDFFVGVESFDLSQYSPSFIWDILDCPAVYKTGTERSHLIYTLLLKRKALFFTVVLIIPIVCTGGLTMLAFYVPVDAGEKVSLSILLLISLIFFLHLIAKILPPSNTTVPIMARYLILTVLMNIVGIWLNVAVCNVFFRGPEIQKMPGWIRKLFLEFLPKFLLLKRPKRRPVIVYWRQRQSTQETSMQSESTVSSSDVPLPPLPSIATVTAFTHHPKCPFHKTDSQPVPVQEDPIIAPLIGIEYATEADQAILRKAQLAKLPESAWVAIKTVDYITAYLKKQEEIRKEQDDWKYVAMVMDRLLLYIYVGLTIGGTFGIFCAAPNAFSEHTDQWDIIDRLGVKYNWFGYTRNTPGS